VVSFYWWSIEWSRKSGTEDLDSYLIVYNAGDNSLEREREREIEVHLLGIHFIIQNLFSRIQGFTRSYVI